MAGTDGPLSVELCLSWYERRRYESTLAGRQTKALIIGSAKTDPVQFKWGFGEGLLKDIFVCFEAYKSPIPKRRKLLAKCPFL